MIHAAVVEPAPSGLQRTLAELALIERAAAFRRRHRDRARLRLRHSDELLRLVEDARLRGFPLVPPGLWGEVVRFIAAVDPQMREDLGHDRAPGHVADVLFMTQGQLMHDAQVERVRSGLAPIIPLFGPPAGDEE
jgi:hypothetical protein